MATLSIRNLEQEVHRALRVRAARNGRSTEAEIREILTDVALPASRLRTGSHLAAIARRFALDDDEVALLERHASSTQDEAG